MALNPRITPTRRAFTMMELLVVIAIMTLLISMLSPSLQSSRQSGRMAQCASNQRQLAIAITNYADERRYFPVGIDAHGVNDQRIWLWPTQSRWYTHNDQDVFHCPQAPPTTRWVREETSGEPAFYGYAANERRIRGYTHKFSYGYNVWGAFMMQNPNTGLGVYRGHHFLDATPAYSVKRPSEMIAFADSNVNDFWSGFIGPYRTGQFPSRIHFGKANVAFVDTHVELMARETLTDVVADHANNKRWNVDHQYHPGAVTNDGVPDFP